MTVNLCIPREKEVHGLNFCTQKPEPSKPNIPSNKLIINDNNKSPIPSFTKLEILALKVQNATHTIYHPITKLQRSTIMHIRTWKCQVFT